jgi:tRNA dimethylallyltransferase
MASPSPRVVGLVGPTASGKSALAEAVALATVAPGSTSDGREPVSGEPGEPIQGEQTPVELVSVDSMAVYRGMDIGTAKPSAKVRARVRYHVLDLVEASEPFTVQQFQQAARAAMADIATRGHRTLLVGGTGLYLRSVVDDLDFPGRYPEVVATLDQQLDRAGPPGSEGVAEALRQFHHRLQRLDPQAASRLDPTNRRRLVRALEVTVGSGRPFSSFGPGLEHYPPSPVALLGLRFDPARSDARISWRFRSLMDAGFLDEVRKLAGQPGGISPTARQALGYRELLSHLEDGVPLTEAIDEAVRRTKALARRQWAWFRRDPRIEWLDLDAGDPVQRILQRYEEPSEPG